MSDKSGISIALLEQFIKDFGGTAVVYKRTDAEVEVMLHDNLSYYDRILDGYLYYINEKLHTGAGGARMFYKAALRQGLSHAEAVEGILVTVDGNSYKLSSLTVQKSK